MGRIQLPLHDDEKLLPSSVVRAEKPSKSQLRVIGLWSLVGLAGLVGFDLGSPSSFVGEVFFKHPHRQPHHHHSGSHSFCPAQVEPLYPKLAFELPESYANESASRLSQAVRIPTVSYDDNGSPEDDPRWQVFYQFHYWLQDTFPRIFKHPNVTITPINRLALLTEIRGSDASLKPLMLTSHYDVVPVPNATLSRWTHPPFEGVFDGEFIWGRGAGDDKSLLVAQYEALSMLLSTGWVPRRSLILAHGFDEEEPVARQGAGHLAPYLEEKYGQNSMLMIVDEGSSAVRMFDTAFAIPATGEKGYLDVRITVGTKGGHSSIPPPHTGIGIMSQIINAIEEKSYEPGFEGPTDPIFQFAMCASEHSNAPKDWKKAIKKREWSGLAKKFAAISPAARAVVSTTQAVDVIQGGVKVNALPEEVVATINHRISFAHSVDYVKKHMTHIVAPIAKKHNLRLSAFNSTVLSSSGLGDSYVQLEVRGIPLEPAPKTPTSGAVWELFSGSIRAVHKDEKSGDKPYVVSPFASTGNTDTKVYWNLSNNIFRYMGSTVPEYESHAHTVDEKTSLKDHLAIVKWIYTLVQNTDSFSD